MTYKYKESNYGSGACIADPVELEYRLPASETQVGGDHYSNMAIQPSEYCYQNKLNNVASNIVKYASRAGNKGDRDQYKMDIEKIIHYAQLWLEYEDFGE